MKIIVGYFTLALCLLAFAAAGAWRFHHLRASESPRAVPNIELVSFAGNTMGGTWSVKLTRLPPDVSSDALEASVGDLLTRLDGQMSIWKPQSDLSRFNQYRGTDWFAAPADLAKVVAEAQRVSGETDGAFDVTVGPLVLLWGFGPQKTGGQIGQIPSEKEIAAARAHVGYRLLEYRLAPPALRKLDPEVYVDLGGIAKGYAAQAVADQLQAMGAKDYLVAVGGELRAHGVSRTGRPWRVGIETPTPDIRRVFEELDLDNASLSTSGDYRNFFEQGGRRYCHEIDPRTGRPIPAGLASVSIIDPSGATADALATALIVLGPTVGFDVARRLKLSALFIVRKGDHFQTLATPEFEMGVGRAGLEKFGKLQ